MCSLHSVALATDIFPFFLGLVMDIVALVALVALVGVARLVVGGRRLLWLLIRRELAREEGFGKVGEGGGGEGGGDGGLC